MDCIIDSGLEGALFQYWKHLTTEKLSMGDDFSIVALEKYMQMQISAELYWS